MNKNGGYTWMQSCATVVCNSKNADEQNIICVNYVISNRENENLILDCCQLEPSIDNIKHEDLSSLDKNSGSPGGDASAAGDINHNGLTGQDTKLTSPKTEPDSQQQQQQQQQQRPRGRGAANNANNNIALVKDNSAAGLNVVEDGSLNSLPTTVATAPTPAPTTTKRKRKSKITPVQQPLDSDNVMDNNNAALNEPNAKVPAVERETPRSRLPSIIDDQQQQQQQQQQQTTAPTQLQNPEASVKDLEQAMSKHLPSPGSVSNPTGQTTDFSADSLLKQQQQQQNEKSSTIQWIGGPHYQQPAPNPMPATALLRQLYANRESVIRATARQTPTGAYYSDQQTGPLPTPPGSESSYDNQYLQLHSHPQKPPTDAFTNLVSTYGYPSSIDYHNAMTPPSSVSPRDTNNSLNAGKTTTTLTSLNGGYDYADPLKSQYTTTTSSAGPTDISSALPLKPQPYSAAAAMHHTSTTDTSSGLTYSNLDQPQYFTPHSSFHLYHKAPPAGGWYSTPS